MSAELQPLRPPTRLEALKRALDPRNILNPGKMLG